MTAPRAWLVVAGWVALLLLWVSLSGCAGIAPRCAEGRVWRDGGCVGFGSGFHYGRGVAPVSDGVAWLRVEGS